MKVEFKFTNDIYAIVNYEAKEVQPHTYDRFWHFEQLKSIPFTNDNELVDALKVVSEMVNMSQHEDVLFAILEYYKDCDVEYVSNGSVTITVGRDKYIEFFDDEFIKKLNSLDADYVEYDDTNKYSFQRNIFYVYHNGYRIATIYN